MKTTDNFELDEFIDFAKTSINAERLTGKNCVRYERVSSKEQEQGYSLETQSKENLQAIEREGFNCLGVFGGKYESAKTDERNEFNRMLKFVKQNKEKISYIVVSDETRFSRSGANAIYIADQLRKENIRIYSVNHPADTYTAAGKMQQNIKFVFAEYDNDLKREKIISNGRQMLLEGYWCTKAPLGYNQITRHKRYNTDLPVRQIISVNETGKLLKKAFFWKAIDKLTNAEIVRKLEPLGLKITKQNLVKVFSNPFYCGILTHNWLNGQVVEGKHEKLISHDVFLQANGMRTKNVKWKENRNYLEVPLKNFMKCDKCGTSFCGYIVKKKNIWYYKCNKTGCQCNKNARSMNDLFMELLNKYSISEKYIAPVKDEFLSLLNEVGKANTDSLPALKDRKKDLETKIKALDERWALGIIAQELYTEYSTKFKKERLDVLTELEKYDNKNSNPEKQIEKYIKLLLNPASLWASSSYMGKLELQEMLFPMGIFYNRENNTFRTPEIDPVAVCLSQLARETDVKLKGDKVSFNTLSPLVPQTGLEPVRS